MWTQLRPACGLFLFLTLLTGVAYPLAVTALAQGIFPTQAGGSLILEGDRVRGSRLLGQSFTQPRYFWGRPSATGPIPYNAAASSGSNLGPTNDSLESAVRERLERLRRADPNHATLVPVELVTASASGLDPEISPLAAAYQVPRVAKERGLSEDAVRRLVERMTSSRTFGVLGEPRVNVLLLNLALDAEGAK